MLSLLAFLKAFVKTPYLHRSTNADPKFILLEE